MVSGQQLQKTDERHWQQEWLEAEDILEILKTQTGYVRSTLNDELGQHHCMLNNINCFIIPEQGDGNGIQGYDALQLSNILENYPNDDLIIIRNFGQNHWVAIKRKIINSSKRIETYTFADSLPEITAYSYCEYINSSDAGTKASLAETIYGKVWKDISSSTFLKNQDKYTFQDLQGLITQKNGSDCGIHSALNAIDMALGDAEKNKVCTKENVANTRKLFCKYKAEKALQGANEHLYVKYEVNNKEWKVMPPSPLAGENNDSPLMELLATQKLVEQGAKQKIFLFKIDDSEATAYIDKNYNHGTVILQTTIEKHTKIITEGLIKAYNEVYGEGTVDFTKIKQIWDIAQQEDRWKKLREQHQNKKATDDEKKMLKFSAKFQKIMENAGLMTGNLKATNFVGMRLKRVSQHHMDALEKQLQQKLSPKSILNANNFNSKSTTQFETQLKKKVHVDSAVDKKEDVDEFVKKFMAKHNENFDTALKEITEGNKTGCWMWYIFPQLKGTGGATNNEDIPDFQTAEKLLKNETFVKNYLQILKAVDAKCEEKGIVYNIKSLEKLFGTVDAKKFVSSITLFDKTLESMGVNVNSYHFDTNRKYDIRETHRQIKELTEKFFTQGITRCNDTTKKITQEITPSQR